MNKIGSFYGGISAYLLGQGLDSVRILNAVNSWVGEQSPNADKTKVASKATLSGKILKSGEDKRRITISDSRKESTQTKATPQGILYAFDSSLRQIAEKFEVSLPVEELPLDVRLWIDSKESFRLNKTAPTPEGETVNA